MHQVKELPLGENSEGLGAGLGAVEGECPFHTEQSMSPRFKQPKHQTLR